MAAKRQRGERAGLTREQVLDAALKLVDRDGLSGLTMRALGGELGVEAMTLYHYVPNKEALIDGIVERVFTEAAHRRPGPRSSWRTELRRYAHNLRLGLLAHPGVLPVVVRPAVTPATLDTVESALRYLTADGFELGMALDALNALTLFVLGHTAAEVAINGKGDGGTLPEALTEERHPLLLQAARHNLGASDAERFDFAVEALLNGFEQNREQSREQMREQNREQD